MSRWRVAVLLILVAAPLLVLAALGGYFLAQKHWSFYAWWPMAACFALAYFLGWYWHRKKQLVRPVDFATPQHWTDRDKGAWKLVEARSQAASKLDADRLGDIQFYMDTGQEMSLELACYYHPGAKDPVGSLTIPEILAVVELASHDLAEIVDKYLPAGHLLTVNDWRRAKQVSDWYTVGSNIYWMVSAVLSPIETGLRYAASQAGMARPLQLLQQNLLLWFYTAYLHRLGTYLIELNSGRLRIGAKRYRELMKAHQAAGTTSFSAEARPAAPSGTRPEPQAESNRRTPPASADQAIGRVTLTIMGQVKAGKSSLVNSLLGEQLARTDVIPATAQVTRYELQPPDIPSKLVLLDTVGYGHTGPTEDQLKATEDSARQSDLLILVLHARNPARQADVELLRKLKDWFATRPDLKMPPVLAVLTHIDLLSPAMEWSPPYHWQEPQRPKEKQILSSYEAVREQLGEFLVGAVPVCTVSDKVYGVEEWLLPTLVELLEEARAVALLRCLRAEADAGKVKKVFKQLLAGSQFVVKAMWEQYKS